MIEGELIGEIPAEWDQDGEFQQTLISQHRAAFWKGLHGLLDPLRASRKIWHPRLARGMCVQSPESPA